MLYIIDFLSLSTVNDSLAGWKFYFTDLTPFLEMEASFTSFQASGTAASYGKLLKLFVCHK